MGTQAILSPARSVLNPILSDEPVVDTEGSSVDVFYTPLARAISEFTELIVAGGAGTALAIAWGMSISGGPSPLVHLFTLLAFAVAGIPALESVWAKLGQLRIDVDVLMLLGAGLAAYIGSPMEGALLLFLFALSGALETLAVRRTHSAITALRELTPHAARVLEGDTTRSVPLRQVSVGATILIKPGERVPLDGVVTEGSSSLDEAAITGESIPRDCQTGDSVFAGTQNLNGRLVVQVSKLASDTTLARIVRLVTESRHNPARAQRLIDRIGPTYSVLVIVSAVAVGLMGWMLGLEGNVAAFRGIALLIVASPCALIIATPVAYLSAIAGAARRGVLIKGGVHLETVAAAGAIAFDKTGTLTVDAIQLVDVVTDGGISEEGALGFAGAISANSTHPLATAVNTAVLQRGPGTAEAHRSGLRVDRYAFIPGEGARAEIDGRLVWFGRPEAAGARAGREKLEWIRTHAERLRSEGKTASALIVGAEAPTDGQAVAILAFQDAIRSDAARCIQRLRRQGVRHLVMLTGDHHTVAAKVAAELELDEHQADLTPEDKVRAAQTLRQKYGLVCLVGDGINDAPALAQADTGVAMGAMGAQIAMEAADIVLIKDRIEAVAWLHRHAKRTANVVRQNLALAIGVICVLSVFAVLGHVPLPLAVIGHEGSTVLVALNGLRLLRAHASDAHAS